MAKKISTVFIAGFDLSKTKELISNANLEFAKSEKKSFELTTATWKHPVEFEIISEGSVDDYIEGFKVVTDNKIWKMVNYGTKPHIIEPKETDGFLSFNSTFSPKTMPGKIKSFVGVSSGSITKVPFVEHPGSEPRDFISSIKLRARLRWETAIKKALKNSKL